MSQARLQNQPEIDIAVESNKWNALVGAEAIITQAIQAGLAQSAIMIMPGAELSIMLCDDARIQAINLEWRKQDKPTNVLSFPAVTPDKLTKSPMLGDIVIAYETLAREAEAEDKRFEDHLSHLTIHGLLHVLGFDHENAAEAEIMEACEIKALARLGIADPYANTELHDK